MKVFISADMEGICGVVNGDMTETADRDFLLARELMTGDVNAAIQGALDAGATFIVVRDAHGTACNILPDRLLSPARLTQGWDSIGLMMMGLDASFDAAVLVGYHARVLTEDGAISHTMTGQTRTLWYAGVPVGESGISAAHAGHFGVPVVCVTGDATLAREVGETLPPGIETAVVKTAFARECMTCLPLDEGRERIRQGVAAGLARRADIAPFLPASPFDIRMQFQRPNQAAAAAFIPTVSRIDELTVSVQASDGLRAAELVEVLLTVAPRR
jgi:D-amino peptidase